MKAYHDLNPGAVFAQLSLLADGNGKTSYERLVDAAIGATPPVPSPVVLDAGCGDGLLLALYGARCPAARLIGIDQSNGEIEIARETLRPFQAGVHAGTIAALELETASVDVAVSHMVLMLVEDPLLVLRELARVLRPGVTLLFVVGRIGAPTGILERAAAQTQALLKHEGKAAPAPDARFRSIAGLRALPWSDLGFAATSVESMDLSRKLTMEQLRTFVTQNYAAGMLSEGGREQLARDVASAAWEFADSNALVEAATTLALVTARRRV